MIYLLDTNVIADYLNEKLTVERLKDAITAGDRVCLCRPVYYETRRGLLKTQSTRKLQTLHEKLIPMLEWVELRRRDWDQAAELWAQTVRIGRQLSDIDLLIAAIAIRYSAVIVSADEDFDTLPVKRVNWRIG